MNEVNNPHLVVFTRLQQNRPRGVAEQDAGLAVGIVHDGAHCVRADDKHLVVRACFNKFRANLQRIDKGTARGQHVESPGMFRANAVLYKTSRRRKEHVRRNAGHNDEIDIFAGNATTLQAIQRRRSPHVRRHFPRRGQVAFTHARPLDDPRVVGIHHRFQVFVRQNALRNVCPERRNLGAPAICAGLLELSKRYGLRALQTPLSRVARVESNSG